MTEHASKPRVPPCIFRRAARIQSPRQRRSKPMRRVILTLLFILPTFAFAQDWTVLPGGGCIGGQTCPEKRLRIPLDEDKAVVSVRFHAHDEVGQKADGALRVKIDGNTINNFI